MAGLKSPFGQTINNDLRARLEAKEFPAASPGILVDDALAIFREWLESEASWSLYCDIHNAFADAGEKRPDDLRKFVEASVKSLASQLGEKDHE